MSDRAVRALMIIAMCTAIAMIGVQIHAGNTGWVVFNIVMAIADAIGAVYYQHRVRTRRH